MVKNYNKILEAVNRGIQLALDDFEDEEQVQNIKSRQIQNRDYTKEYLDWQELINKFELEQQIASDIIRLAELSKLLNLKYKISLERLYNFIRNYIDKHSSLFHADLNWIDTSEIYTMENLFYESKFDGDISEWDVSNVENMPGMFYNSCFNGDISNWDVSKVKNMESMFCGSWFKRDISKWDVSSVKYMNYMFAYTSFNRDISNWDVSNCINFSNMFMNDTIFCQDLSNWKIKRGSKCDLMFWGTKIVNYDNYMPQFV